ncbi:hypothetical protein ACFPH6_00855 [Streptomyces xiangluensis]|uniref:Golgi phosphoprotein 3 (GPP34) n=1 Tax=Streptomyces xiangluensis TaxID=2665720 RepID=A0ABV8YH72_9ACTN
MTRVGQLLGVRQVGRGQDWGLTPVGDGLGFEEGVLDQADAAGTGEELRQVVHGAVQACLDGDAHVLEPLAQLAVQGQHRVGTVGAFGRDHQLIDVRIYDQNHPPSRRGRWARLPPQGTSPTLLYMDDQHTSRSAHRAALAPDVLRHALLRTLARTSLLDVLSQDERAAVDRLPDSDPAATLAFNMLLACAYESGAGLRQAAVS